jgi:hypothetical protein
MSVFEVVQNLRKNLLPHASRIRFDEFYGRKGELQEFQSHVIEKAKLAAFYDAATLSPDEECALIDLVSCTLARGEIPADSFRHPLTQLLNCLRRSPQKRKRGMPSARPHRVPCPCIECCEQRRTGAKTTGRRRQNPIE